MPFDFNRSLQSGLPYIHHLYAFNLNALNIWGIMGEFDTLLMHWFDRRFRPPTLGCFLWAFFVNFNGMIHVVTFWFGGNSWLPYLVSLTLLLSFCEGSHDSWRDSLLGIPLYLWDTLVEIHPNYLTDYKCCLWIYDLGPLFVALRYYGHVPRMWGYT